MEYIYDILLNFQETYCDFFEWQLSDKIINVKKISLYKITNKDYLNLKYHDIIFEENPFSKNNRMVLVTNGLEVMGILLNNNNQIIKRSSLLLDEASDILEYLPNLKALSLKYKKNTLKQINYQGRLHQEKQAFLNKFFNNINLKRDEYLLKYLYFDIYNQEESNINKIYQSLLELKNNNYQKLYTSIKTIINNK